MSLKTIRLQLAVFVGGLVACEIFVRLVAASPAGVLLEPTPLWVPDPELRRRGNPRHYDHDARGYRNRAALATAAVVAIGDSHTYGIGVQRNEAWPAVLAERAGASVYSMAHGGYGPGHYERLLTEALALAPEIILVGVYMGNDLFDAYALGRETPAPPRFAELARRAATLDREAPIEAGPGLFSLGRLSRIRRWLGTHVYLYRLAYNVRQQLMPAPRNDQFKDAVAALTPADRQLSSVEAGQEWRTIMRAAYRHRAVNGADPRIQLGFERSVEALTAMAARCRAAGVDMRVVVFPTKESVFWPRVAEARTHPQLVELVEEEDSFRSRLARRLRRADIPVLDLLPALRSAATQPYPQNLDGHPSPAGHRVIAAHIAGWLGKHESSSFRTPAAERR